MKSALQDLLSVSYGMISITSISHQRGGCISNARRAVVWFSDGRKPGCKGFIQNWRLLSIKRRRTSPAQRCFIPPEGGSPQPACKAKPFTGRTLGAQGRQARRRHQPSRRSRVNLRDYSFPPNPSQKPIFHQCRTQQKSTNHNS